MNNELVNYTPILNKIKTTLPLHSVICTESGRILCFTNYIKTAIVVSSSRNTKLWMNLHLTHKIPSTLNLSLPQYFIFNIPSQTFKRKNLTEEECYKYIIISERAAAIDELHRFLDREYLEEEITEQFIQARKEENEEMRKRYITLLSQSHTLEQINKHYDELRREACVYGNF